MDSSRLADLMLWRDAQLFKSRGNEGAAIRLAKGRTLSEAMDLVEKVLPPSQEERRWIDSEGEPIDPDHHWWKESRHGPI